MPQQQLGDGTGAGGEGFFSSFLRRPLHRFVAKVRRTSWVMCWMD